MKKIVILFIMSLIIYSCRNEHSLGTVNDIESNAVHKMQKDESDNLRKTNSVYGIINDYPTSFNYMNGYAFNSNINRDPSVPYLNNQMVYFWSFDPSLNNCRGCVRLADVIVNYIENYSQSPGIIPNKYINYNYGFSAQNDSNFGFEHWYMNIYQDYTAGTPPEYWTYPYTQPLPIAYTNDILQYVIQQVNSAVYQPGSKPKKITAIDIHHVSYFCDPDICTNGMKISLKFSN